MELRPYPQYKDSEIPWLDKVPAHWSLKRAKFLFREIDDRTDTGQETLLSMRHDRGLVPHNDVSSKEISDADLIGYKRTWPGDIVMNRMRASSGLFAETFVHGLVSPDYAVFQPITANVDSEYFVRLFKCPEMGAKFRAESKGLGTGTAGFLRLYSDSFGALTLPVPPGREQTAIVHFLVAQNQQFAHFIRTKQQLIELLNEQKQAIIQQAVTRGLDPKVSVKRTGLDWLPEVPEHWKVSKLKFAARLIVGGSTPPSQQLECWNGDVVWVTPEDIAQKETLSDSSRRITVQGVASCSTVLVPSGSIVITSRAPVGNLAIAAVELCTNQGCKAIVPHLERLDSQYGYYLLHVLKLEIQSLAKGTTFPEISTFELSNIQIPLPRIEEQQEIRDFILEESWSINQAIERTHREIDLIREYRTRLVSDVVTGKLDVRDADLPDIEEENRNLLPIEPDDDGHGELLAAEGVGDVNL